MESPTDAGQHLSPAQPLSAADLQAPVRCPICGSDQTAVYRTDVVDLEYFVEPPRAFVIQKCARCQSEFLDPRPTESELPPFYPK